MKKIIEHLELKELFINFIVKLFCDTKASRVVQIIGESRKRRNKL